MEGERYLSSEDEMLTKQPRSRLRDIGNMPKGDSNQKQGLHDNWQFFLSSCGNTVNTHISINKSLHAYVMCPVD